MKKGTGRRTERRNYLKTEKKKTRSRIKFEIENVKRKNMYQNRNDIRNEQ